MPRHRITTASLLQDFERRRADEASLRWDELTREVMRDDAESDAESGVESKQPVR